MRDEDKDPEGRLDRLFAGLRPAAPPAPLRQRVLRASRAALREMPRPDAWTLLWESRPLRLAWGAATIALLFVHVAITPGRRETAERVARTPSRARPDFDREVAAIARLPRIDARAEALVGSIGERPARRPERKERPS